MALVATDGRFLQVNRSLCEILGYSPEELTSTRWQVTIHPDDIEITQSHMRRLLAGETNSCHFERRCLHKRGHEVWSLQSLSLVRQADGTPLYFISQLQDITERKRAEEALRESEERFRSAFEHAAIGMALVRPDGRLLQVNPSFCQMLGYSEQELLATTWQAITHPDDVDVGDQHVRRILHGESEACQFEKRYLHKAGHIIWGLLSFSLLRDAAGSPLYFISQIQDITERKRAEEALRESEERFRSVFESAPIAIAFGNAEGRPIQINRTAEQMLGYTQREMESMVYTDFTHPGDVEESVRLIGELLEGKRDHFRMEKRYYRKDGRLVWASTVVSALRNAKGANQYVTMIEDITERKRAQEALQAAREELEGKVEHQMLRRNPYGLTFRELTVLHLVAAGRPDKEIGVELGISPLTAQKHVSNILAKMDVASRTEAAARALREGLLE